MPEDIKNLAFYTIGQLAELIRTKQITSIELRIFFLERLKKYDSALHCVITLTEDRALRQAKLMDHEEIAAGKYRGLLHGIPFGAKDLLSTKNYNTTWGSVPFKDQMIVEDATVIKKLQDAGAVLCAKLTMGGSLEISSQELLQRNAEIQAIFKAIPDFVMRLDPEGRVLDYKKAIAPASDPGEVRAYGPGIVGSVVIAQ